MHARFFLPQTQAKKIKLVEHVHKKEMSGKAFARMLIHKTSIYNPPKNVTFYRLVNSWRDPPVYTRNLMTLSVSQ